MFLRELFEADAQRTVAVMAGGFHPFHPGHKSLYDWSVKTFGKENVYVAATNDVTERPFPFDVKKKLATMAGVPAERFIQINTSPFNARAYTDLLDPNTALVFIRSDKDRNEAPLPDKMKIDRKTKQLTNEPRYIRSWTGKDVKTHDEMGYMVYGPTVDFDFSGMQIKSASELRATWPNMSDEDKHKAAALMYGNGHDEAVQLLDKALGDTEAPVDEAMPYTGNSPQYKGVRIPTDDTVDAKDITKKSKQVDMPVDTIDDFDFSGVDGAKLKKVVAKLVSELPGSPKNIKVLQARFGLAPFQQAFTLQQVADAMDVTPEVIRQREAKAIRMLKHPTRARELRPFLEAQLNEAVPFVAAAIWIVKWAIKYGAWPVIKWLLKRHGGKIIAGGAAAYYIDQGWDWVISVIGAEYAQMLIDNKIEIGAAVALIIGAVTLKKYIEKQGEKLVSANESLIARS